MTLTISPFDDLFKATERQFSIVTNMLKALARHESRTPGHPDWYARAYRYEPAYWERYLKDDPRYATRDPREVSASYGLCQLMYPTAVSLGFGGLAEELYNPAINIDLGGRYLRLLLDEVWRDKSFWYDFEISAMDCALARYNGGAWRNPDVFGHLRNQSYVDKIMAEWERLKA
jgi:soluble lytic murein transglycosylase-like protein